MILSLTAAERFDLFADCTSLPPGAMRAPNYVAAAGAQQHADTLATALALDMTAYWQPTASGLFGRLTNPRIADAVREGVSLEAAQSLAGLNKPAMAERAEKLLASKS